MSSLRNTSRRSKRSKATTTTSPNSKFLYLLYAFLASAMVALIYFFVTSRPASVASVQPKMERMGEVISTHDIPGSDMTAWYIKEKGTGQSALYYTSNDGSTIASGMLYDTETGAPLTDKLLSELVATDPSLASGAVADQYQVASPSAQELQPDLTPAQAIGDYEGDIPTVFTDVLDKLGGYKEDASIAPKDTIYVIYDPRCPYCHKLYEATRNIDMKAKGVTIKWLPSVALGVKGDSDPVIGQAAYGLTVTTPEEFAAGFSQTQGAEKAIAHPTEDQLQALDANLDLLYKASDQTFGADSPKAVPAAFYLDKRNGQPRMVYGAQEPEILRSIFGD